MYVAMFEKQKDLTVYYLNKLFTYEGARRELEKRKIHDELRITFTLKVDSLDDVGEYFKDAKPVEVVKTKDVTE